MSQKSKARWKVILNVFSFVLLVVLVYALRGQIAESFRTVGHIRWWLLLFIPVLQFFNYDAYSRQNKHLFAILGQDISYKFLYKVNLELNFINNILPSGGVSGFSYFSLRMKEKDVPGAQSSLVQLMRFILVYLSFLVLLMLALIMLSFSGQVNRLVLLVGGSLSTLIVIGTLGMTYIVGSQQRISGFFAFFTRIANRIIHTVRPKHPETINVTRVRNAFENLHLNYVIIKSNIGALKRPFFWSLVANTTEILTVYTVYLAFGHLVNPGAVILAYAIANFAGFISVLPSGLGIYETLMTAVLAIGGVSAAISLPVTVMYRITSMFTQLVPGYIMYYRHMHKKGS